MDPDLRWKQRFQNFDRAYQRLHAALEDVKISSLSELEQEGVVQRFEYTFELAWKTMKDFMAEGGHVFTAVMPRQVIKDAFAAKLITDGQAWIDMLNTRNQLSHDYDKGAFLVSLASIQESHLPALAQLHEFFAREISR